MKAYKLSIGSPVYQEVYSYAKKQVKKIVKYECRKHLILRFAARHTSFEHGQAELDGIVAYFSKLTGSNLVADLSSLSWGEPSSFDERKGLFLGAICIPKDFDDQEGQKNLLNAAVRNMKIYSISQHQPYRHSRSHNKRL